MEWEHPFGMGDHEPCGPSSYALLTNRWNLAFSLSLSFFIQQMIDPQLSQVSISRLYLIKGRSRGPQRGALPVTKCTEPHEISQKNQETQLIMTMG